MMLLLKPKPGEGPMVVAPQMCLHTSQLAVAKPSVEPLILTVLHDTDWFNINVGSEETYSFNLVAEFKGKYTLVDVTDCDNPSIIPRGYAYCQCSLYPKFQIFNLAHTLYL